MGRKTHLSVMGTDMGVAMENNHKRGCFQEDHSSSFQQAVLHIEKMVRWSNLISENDNEPSGAYK